MKRTPAPVLIEISSDEDEDGRARRPSETVLVELEGCIITSRHQKILSSPSDWLTDDIITAFCHRIAEADPTVHCCSTFFFTRLQHRGLDEDWLRKWRKTVRAQKRRIMVPINWGNSHWALAVLHMESEVIQGQHRGAQKEEATLHYFDSLMSKRRAREALSILEEAFVVSKVGLNRFRYKKPPAADTKRGNEPVGLLAFVMSKVKIAQPPDSPTKDASRRLVITAEIPSAQPQQTDGSSCGVFVCWWIARLCDLLPSRFGDSPNPARFRQFIFRTIMSGYPKRQ